MTRLPLVAAAIWTTGGILLGLLRPVPDRGGPFLVLLAVAGAALAAGSLARGGPVRAARSVGPRGAVRVLLLMAASGALLGSATRRAAERSCPRWLPLDVPVRVLGTVTEVEGERLVLDVDTVWVGGRALPCGASIPARREGGGGLRVGDRREARGRWWSPPGPASALGRPGSFLVDSMAPARPHRPDEAGAEPLVPRLRRRIRERVDALFGARAPLAASLLLAQRGGLAPEVRDRYARAGLSHLLAISGLHVGLVAGILLILASLLRLGPRTGPLAAAAATLLYVAFLGAPHSAVRAGVQVVLLLAARVLQRPTRPAAAVAAAALAILAVEPGAVLSPGFQLSFAGVAGLLAFRRPLLELAGPLASLRWGRIRAGHWLADGLATSVAATVATAPIVAWHFGRVAPIGIAANLVAIPLLAVTVPALVTALVVSVPWPAAGQFLAAPGGLLLDALDRVAGAAAAVPWGTAAVTGPAALAATGAAAAGWVAAGRLGRVRPPVRMAVRAGVAVAVLAVAPLRPGGDRVELHMIDVGQGDAIALRTPAGRLVLVDAGVGGRDFDAGARRVVPYLARHGARRLEALVLTHADADHSGGAAAVVRALRPHWVGDPGVVASKPLYLGLLQSVTGAGVPWVGLARGVTVRLDGVTLEFLYPERVAASVEDANDASLVLRVEYGRFAALLTGDAPAAVERGLVARYGRHLDADVLKVGHHGSATSTSVELLAAAGPEVALVSVGRGNRYGHPSGVVIRRLRDRGVRVLRSDRDGSVVVRGERSGRFSVKAEHGGGS